MKDPLPEALPFGYRPDRRIHLFHESRGLQTFTFRFALRLYPDVAVRVLLTLSLALSPRFPPRSFERRSEGKGRDDRWSRWELNPHCITTCQSALHPSWCGSQPHKQLPCKQVCSQARNAVECRPRHATTRCCVADYKPPFSSPRGAPSAHEQLPSQISK